jgi:hypothetical protein
MARTATLLLFIGILTGCAARYGNVETPVASPLEGKRVLVFSFQDPYYRGQQLRGVGEPFAVVFATKLRTAGVQADGTSREGFSTSSATDPGKACKHAADNGYDALVLGNVTEWIDGATQWSGRVDVAALSVTAFDAKTCRRKGKN